MMIRGQWFIVGVVAFVAVTNGSPAIADTMGPARTYKEVVPGDKYVFVMLSPEMEMGTLTDMWPVEARAIRAVYAKSGMYRNDGSAEPLWTVDWYNSSIVPTSDGVHVIRHGPNWAPDHREPLGPALENEALSFFANGQLLRTYKVKELVTNPSTLPRSVSHFHWRAEGNLDDDRMEYALATQDGNKFVFDVRTGAIKSESRVPITLDTFVSSYGWWVGFGILAVGIAGWLGWRRRAKGNTLRAGAAT